MSPKTIKSRTTLILTWCENMPVEKGKCKVLTFRTNRGVSVVRLCRTKDGKTIKYIGPRNEAELTISEEEFKE